MRIRSSLSYRFLQSSPECVHHLSSGIMRFSAASPFVAVGLLPTAFACLCEQTAYGVSNNFEHLFKNYTKEFAQSALSRNYTDQTDSVAWLINNGTECPHPV